MSLDYSHFFRIYKEYFLPAYSDLVAYLADKPQQILIEIENTFSHIAQTYNNDISQAQREDNLKKATAHMQRISLDCYKLLWAKMKGEIDVIFQSKDLRSFGLNMSEAEFIAKKEKFRGKVQEARKLELENVGVDPLKSLDAFGEAVSIGWEILKSIDENKIHKLKKKSAIDKIKHFFIDILMGNIVSNIIWLLLGLFIAKMLQ